MERYINNISIAIDAITNSKLRSILTTLGIICGVASVICMLAIGNGAKKEILEQLSLVGVNNIIINANTSDENETSKNDQTNVKSVSSKYSPGLTIQDLDAIKEVLPTLKMASPKISYNVVAINYGKRLSVKLVGVNSDYFKIFNLLLEEGFVFNEEQQTKGIAVCVIGGNIKSKLFSTKDPIGQNIKCNGIWLKVVGVLKKENYINIPSEEIGISRMDDMIFIPVKTFLLRVKNRGFISVGNMKQNIWTPVLENSGAGFKQGGYNYNQLDQIIVQIVESNQLESSAKIISRILSRRHQDINDFEIRIPELLLKQQQKTKDIFNIVLGAIASISLIVGGIGIMNIMYASVLERISEIGIRLAVGANRKDIIFQFLSEAILISFSGGLIGVILGVVLSKLISHFAGISTVITFVSIIISFGVSVAVGIIFGYSPAKQASNKNPVESLRHE